MPRYDSPDTRVHDALRRIGPLPVLGGTVARIRTLANDPHGTTTDLVSVIESDEAFSAHLLRYANSAAHARHHALRAPPGPPRVPLGPPARGADAQRFVGAPPGGGSLSRGQLHVHAVT